MFADRVEGVVDVVVYGGAGAVDLALVVAICGMLFWAEASMWQETFSPVANINWRVLFLGFARLLLRRIFL